MMNLVSKLSTLNTKLIVFDLDGTLYNKRGLSLRMVLHAPLDIRKMQAERATRASMKGMWLGDEKHFDETYFQRMAARMHCSATAAEQWYNQRYMPLMVKIIKKHYQLVPWVMPFIQQCKKLGVRLVVLSDYGHTTEKLQALGLEQSLFDWVVSAPELGGLKPAPQLMARVAEQMGVQPNQCLVIGDREDTDGELARAVGATYWRCNNEDPK